MPDVVDPTGPPAPPAPADPTANSATGTGTVTVPLAITATTPPPVNGNGHMRNWLIVFLGMALILEILGDNILAVLLLFKHLRKASYEPIFEFVKQGVQVKTMLISGLLGALTQRALDAMTSRKT